MYPDSTVSQDEPGMANDWRLRRNENKWYVMMSV